VALVSAAAACLALASDGAASRLVFGWLAIWGWAGLFVHGLVRGELAAAPPRAGSWAFGLHVVGLVAGGFAIALGGDALARATGLVLIASGAITAAGRLR